jgi:hypothetical protein
MKVGSYRKIFSNWKELSEEYALKGLFQKSKHQHLEIHNLLKTQLINSVNIQMIKSSRSIDNDKVNSGRS